MSLSPNTIVSHYSVRSKIGAGGMGEVYLAQDMTLGRKVAMKFLNEKLSSDRDKLYRFVQEAKAASALNHPNILTVYEIGEVDGRNYIASEFIEGKTLRDHVRDQKQVGLEVVLDIGIQVCEALVAAHDVGIVHRDIKPENIMVRNDGIAKILDFGIVKLTEKETDKQSAIEEAETLRQTAPGIVMGTVSYMSPEQVAGRKVDRRTDIWSLGIVLYEMLAGRLPFKGITTFHTMVAILDQEPPPISSHGPHASPGLLDIVTKSLAKDVANRYQTSMELLNDLKSLRRQLQFEVELRLRSKPNAGVDVPSNPFIHNESKPIDSANTIAVLPFVNISRDENGDYFSDGLAEELLNVLSKIRGLKVAARTSSFSFKGKETTIADIGRTLSVASVLEGSIRVAGSRVRISVQLIKVEDGFQLWSETYDRTMDDVFAVQDDIAQCVVKELRLRLLNEDSGGRVISEVAEAVKGRADNPEAQRLMLLGRYLLDRTTREDTAKAIEYFRAALDVDPGYALCWAELGRAYSIEAGRAWAPVDEGFDRSRDATKRALALEPNLAEGHAQLGRIQLAHDWDLRGAETSYHRALAIAPGSSAVLDGASVLQYKLGKFDTALELSRRVLVQDPLSAAFWHNLGLACEAAGQITEAEQAFRKALELAPRRFVSRALLSVVLISKEDKEDALRQAELEADEFWRLWALAIVRYALGMISESDEAVQNLIKNHSDGNAFQIAEVHAMRGEIDLAFHWLERGISERDAGVTHARVDPRLRRLHGDPRWVPLLTRIGFDA
jgi:serine/threonine protein kinase